MKQISNNWIVFVLLSLYPLVGMGIDLIAPSLPAMSSDLHISQDVIKNLIGIYLFGYATGNFIIGFLSDAWGRRNLIILGFVIFFLVSLLPPLFPNESVLLTSRFLQGFSIAASAVLSRAVFADILTPKELFNVAGLLSAVWGVGPIIGPVIGGYLQDWVSWKANFYFFSAYSLIGIAALIFFLPETRNKREPLNYKVIKKTCITLLSHRLFIALAMIMGISYSVLVVFNVLGPFLIQKVMGYSAITFGHLALFLGIAFIVGTFICRFSLVRYPAEKVLFYALPILVLFALGGLILAYIFPLNLWVIVAITLVLYIGSGIIYPHCMGKCLTLFQNLGGSSSAVMNLINILITSLMAFLASFVYVHSFVSIAWIFFSLSLLRHIAFWILAR